MAKCREDPLAACPFYKEEEPQLVHCEGILDGCTLHLGFSNRGKLRNYKNSYCQNRWEHCRIARMLNEKYNDTP